MNEKLTKRHLELLEAQVKQRDEAIASLIKSHDQLLQMYGQLTEQYNNMAEAVKLMSDTVGQALGVQSR